MVLLTLEQVAKLYGFTDKHKAKRIIGAPRVSGEHRVSTILAALRPTSSSGVLALYDKMHNNVKQQLRSQSGCSREAQLRHQVEQASLLLLDGGAARAADRSVGYDVKNL